MYEGDVCRCRVRRGKGISMSLKEGQSRSTKEEHTKGPSTKVRMGDCSIKPEEGRRAYVSGGGGL